MYLDITALIFSKKYIHYHKDIHMCPLRSTRLSPTQGVWSDLSGTGNTLSRAVPRRGSSQLAESMTISVAKVMLIHPG